ncbi:hypothetical protein Agabi119p4_5453 [Agaricus bisporus var. burnettii]|uniref:Uncharacterized protein n=1 Tax=Agaricus bisporus var. burnettii TaxID=192524 RepID=A0A8H7F1Q8_AGABI|nr:hypothetical protein Agabi119p4_5453 [Agaricus bisporus var. burnettii]
MPEASLRPLSLSAASVARVHTILASTAFASALIIGSLLHYKKIVKNGVAGYPHEWFPSVSATIGDWYPERNIFQIIIALTSGPRFALIYLQYYLQTQQTKNTIWPTFLFVIGLIRTLACGGWVYITSSDDHDAHDVFMILYIVCNIPWMVGGVLSSGGRMVRKRRSLVAYAFFFTIIPLVYFFIQHKVYRIPGAYTRYAFFEWGLIFFDVFFDSITEQEFVDADLSITVGTALQVQPSETESSKLVSQSDAKANPSVNGEKVVSVTEISIWSSLSALAPRSFISFLSDVYLSCVFLTLFTALIPTLFYFSIWELGLAGTELALFSVLSPFLLAHSSISAFAESQTGQVVLQGLSLSGLLAYLLKEPLARLLLVAPAVQLATLAATAKWTEADGSYQAIIFGLGWVLTSLLKHANHSNNPLWPFINAKAGGYNKTGSVLAILALAELATRPRAPSDDVVTLHREKKTHWLPVSLALGSLVFSIHSLLADSSALITWSWTGYENGAPRGPLPHVHSALTIVVQCIGLAIGTYASSIFIAQSSDSKDVVQQDKIAHSNSVWTIISHPGFYTFGATSTYVLYKYKNWPGYIGGLGVAFFLTCVTPIVFHQICLVTNNGKTRNNLGRTFGTAFLVYCLMMLANIFTVAYAFVPGGVYFRERTDLVLLTQVALFFPMFVSPSDRTVHSSNSKSSLETKASYIYLLLAVTSVLSGLVTVYRLPSSPPQPFRPGPRIIQAGIWTVHFGFDNEGHDSQRGIRNLLRDMQLDIVGLLETDLQSAAFGHRDLTRVIVEDLGYNVDLGPGPGQHTWGCVLLTKFPIIRSTHHLLPSPHGELAPAIEAVLDIYGTEVTVVVSHNGQEEDPLDRELQSTELARIMAASYPKPVIFLGYVVTKPHASRPNPYEIMVADGRVHDIDQEDTDRWCEYIFYRGLYRTSYARISRGIITDTEMQIGQFVLPRYGTGIVDDSYSARYSRAFKEQLPVEHWFPMEYHGGPGKGGVDGHYYHVFGTPLYYFLPANATV